MEMRSDPRNGECLTVLFSATLFLNAALSFGMQPMIGNMVLPLLGGVPAVWNTCMVFFQSTLLLGYAYAHWSTRWIGSRYHALAHLASDATACDSSSHQCFPTNDELAAYRHKSHALAAGLSHVDCWPSPLVVSATAPLLQKWFASTTHPDAGNPYFLYAASNAGSLFGLLGYPILVEPRCGWRNKAGSGLLVTHFWWRSCCVAQ